MKVKINRHPKGSNVILFKGKEYLYRIDDKPTHNYKLASSKGIVGAYVQTWNVDIADENGNILFSIPESELIYLDYEVKEALKKRLKSNTKK